MRYLETRIIYVDPSRGVFDSITIDGYNWCKDVCYINSGLKLSGDVLIPEIGDIAIVSLEEDGQAIFHKYYKARTIDDNKLTKFIYGLGGNFKSNELINGDHTITGPDGAWLNLMRGGLAGVGVSSLCQTVYVALEGLIRTISQNVDFISSGIRFYSVNDNGSIITRACFSSSDRHFATGAQNNEDAVSENFEYQIDITKDGMTFFVGDIDSTTKKRNNNLVITLKPSGDINLQCGAQIIFDLYSNGGLSYKVVDQDHKIIYNKTVATNGDRVLVKEIVKGDVVRYVDGNIQEQATGTIDRQAQSLSNSATFIDNNSTTIRNSTGLNIKEIDLAPNANVKIK